MYRRRNYRWKEKNDRPATEFHAETSINLPLAWYYFCIKVYEFEITSRLLVQRKLNIWKPYNKYLDLTDI